MRSFFVVHKSKLERVSEAARIVNQACGAVNKPMVRCWSKNFLTRYAKLEDQDRLDFFYSKSTEDL